MHTRLPGLRQGTTVCVHTSMDMEQRSDRKLITPSGMGLLVCGAGSHPSYHLGVVRRNVPTGVNLNQYAGPGSHIRWHSDNEPLFGPQNLPKLIISLSSGHSVVFQVRRAPGDVPSSISLDHGDILMDGLAQLEYEHCTVSGLQGPRVNLTYPWVAQHTASCPLAGVVGCVLPTCAQGLVEPSSRWLGERENKWSSSWGLVLLLLCPFGQLGGGIVTVVSVHPARRCTSPLGVVPGGLGDGVVTTSPISQECVFLFPFYIMFSEKTLLFF